MLRKGLKLFYRYRTRRFEVDCLVYVPQSLPAGSVGRPTPTGGRRVGRVGSGSVGRVGPSWRGKSEAARGGAASRVLGAVCGPERARVPCCGGPGRRGEQRTVRDGRAIARLGSHGQGPHATQFYGVLRHELPHEVPAPPGRRSVGRRDPTSPTRPQPPPTRGRSVGATRVGTGRAREGGSVGRGRGPNNQLRTPQVAVRGGRRPQPAPSLLIIFYSFEELSPFATY